MEPDLRCNLCQILLDIWKRFIKGFLGCDWSKLGLQCKKRDRRIETLMGLRGTFENFNPFSRLLVTVCVTRTQLLGYGQ